MSRDAVDVHRLEDEELATVIEALAGRPGSTHRRRAELQARGNFVYLVAWIEGRPVGHVGVGLNDHRQVEDVCEWRGYALVSDLAVDPHVRRRGVGRALMEKLEHEAREAGMPGVGLDTGTGAEFAAARELYRSLGYRDQRAVFLGGWSDPAAPGVHFADPMTQWFKDF